MSMRPGLESATMAKTKRNCPTRAVGQAQSAKTREIRAQEISVLGRVVAGEYMIHPRARTPTRDRRPAHTRIGQEKRKCCSRRLQPAPRAKMQAKAYGYSCIQMLAAT